MSVLFKFPYVVMEKRFTEDSIQVHSLLTRLSMERLGRNLDSREEAPLVTDVFEAYCHT